MSLRTPRNAAALALGLVAVASRAHAQTGDFLSKSEMSMASYITAANNANPNGVSSTAAAGASGTSTGYNDPQLGFNSTQYWAKDAKYSGVTQLIMTYDAKNLSTGAVSAAAFICTGALINGGYSVLTAGHCLNNHTDVVSGVSTQYTLKSVQVRLGQNFGGNTTGEPGAGAPNVNQSFNFVQDLGTTAVVIHPDYTGSVIDQRDVALINLGAAAPSIYQRYELYTGSAIGQQYNITGWGGRGNGNLGTFASGTAGARIRQGLNTFDVSYADPRWNAEFMDYLFGDRGPQDVYLSDFDNGTATNDALCRLASADWDVGMPMWSGNAASRPCGTGLGLDEVSSAGGDSGGPSFVNGKVAAITSFGQSWGTSYGDFRSGLQSSFGEFNGMTRVDINAEWINNNTTTPEPATFVLVGGGLLGLGAFARRRRQA